MKTQSSSQSGFGPALQETLYNTNNELLKQFVQSISLWKRLDKCATEQTQECKQTESNKSQLVKLEPNTTGFLSKLKLAVISQSSQDRIHQSLELTNHTGRLFSASYSHRDLIEGEQSDAVVVPAKKMERSYSEMDRPMVHVGDDGNVVKGNSVIFISEMTPKRAPRRSGEISAEEKRQVLSTKASSNQSMIFFSPANDLHAQLVAAKKVNNEKIKSSYHA